MAQQTHQAPEKQRERHSAGRQEAGQQEGIQDEGSSREGRSFGEQGGSQTSSHSLPGITIRSMGRICDIQLAATRMLLQTQASAARAFGWPDYSGLFRVGDERVRRIFSAGTEQFLNLAEQAKETTSEVQRQVGQMLESQAVNEAESWQRGMEEIGQQAGESLEELKELARLQAEESLRIAETVGEESRAAIRQGAEQFRQTVREGAEQGRQMVAQQGENVREQTEQTSGEMQEAGESAGQTEEEGRSERQAPKRKVS